MRQRRVLGIVALIGLCEVALSWGLVKAFGDTARMPSVVQVIASPLLYVPGLAAAVICSALWFYLLPKGDEG